MVANLPNLEKNLNLDQLLPHSLPRMVENRPKLSTSVGHLGTTSLTNRRKVHEDGKRMLENQLAIKQSEMKASILENRLKHLENEEIKAQRKLRAAEKSASEILDRRERN